MSFIVADTVSGRIVSMVEGVDATANVQMVECEVSNTSLHVCYCPEADPSYVFSKWWNHENHAPVDKIEMSVTFSHPHVEKDFFGGTTIPGIINPETQQPVVISRQMAGPSDWEGDEAEAATSYLRFNDFDEIVVSSNTVVTISDIPNDYDTKITLNGFDIEPSTSINVSGPINVVQIDSPKYFIKTIEIREE